PVASISQRPPALPAATPPGPTSSVAAIATTPSALKARLPNSLNLAVGTPGTAPTPDLATRAPSVVPSAIQTPLAAFAVTPPTPTLSLAEKRSRPASLSSGTPSVSNSAPASVGTP